MSQVDAYLRYAETYKGVKPERVTRVRRVLLELGDSVGAELGACNAADLTEYLMTKLEDGINPNTVRQYRGMILAFYRWLWHDAEVISADSFLRLREVPTPAGSTSNMQPNPYSRTELAQFWTVLDKRFPVASARALKRRANGTSSWKVSWRHPFRLQTEAVVALALEMGLRRHEIWSLSLDDLHYDNAYVVVNGKGDKPREVPFTDRARECIHDWIEFRAGMRLTHDRPWIAIYHWRDGCLEPLGLRSFGRIIERVMHYEGGKRGEWTLHRFRHTCATERLRAGMSLEAVSAMLGHANLQQTLAYAKLVRRDVARQMAGSSATFESVVRPRVLEAAASSSEST